MKYLVVLPFNYAWKVFTDWTSVLNFAAEHAPVEVMVEGQGFVTIEDEQDLEIQKRGPFVDIDPDLAGLPEPGEVN